MSYSPIFGQPNHSPLFIFLSLVLYSGFAMKPQLSWLFCGFSFAFGTKLQKPLSRLDLIAGSGSGEAPPAYRGRLLSLHKSLVDIESISGNEADVGHFLIEYLTQQLSYKALRQDLPKGDRPRFNVVAYPGGSVHMNARVLVTSHIDVVPPYWPYEIETPLDKVDHKTVIHGRGSVDAKASVAAQIIAVNELLRSEAIRDEDVALLYVVGEEVSGDGMRHFSDSLSEMKPPYEFDAVIFGEPTENKLACGHKGHMECQVTAKGMAGHSGYPWLGKSATELLIRGLVNVLDRDLGSSELFGNTTVNVGIIEGGVAGNVIPESASAELALRVATGPQHTGQETVRSALREALKQVDPDALHVECDQGYGAVKCDCDVEGTCLSNPLFPGSVSADTSQVSTTLQSTMVLMFRIWRVTTSGTCMARAIYSLRILTTKR
jgi:acetylornithine deacetylase